MPIVVNLDVMMARRKMSLNELSEKVDFNFIRYANCWEDADVLLQALQVKENAHVLSIASAGDNSFSFLTNNNVKVYAVDLNPVQIHLCEFKKTAIQYYQQCLDMENHDYKNSLDQRAKSGIARCKGE